MRPIPARPILVLLVALLLPVQSKPAHADRAMLVPATTLQPADPCSFYRGQAFGKGLTHFATEMLWACEAISDRRGADLRLGAALQAAAEALDRYREAMLAASRARFVESRAGAPRPGVLGLDEASKRALAERSGVLVALDAIRTGF